MYLNTISSIVVDREKLYQHFRRAKVFYFFMALTFCLVSNICSPGERGMLGWGNFIEEGGVGGVLDFLLPTLQNNVCSRGERVR